MEIYKGIRNNYKWIETDSNFVLLSDFIEKFSEFFIDLQLAIISFDSGSFIPSKEEIDRGWRIRNGIAYFQKLTLHELKHPKTDNSFDQWLLFDRPIEFDCMDIYVNYSGFSMINDLNSNLNSKFEIESMSENIRDRFWNEIEVLSPSKFILYGDRFIFGTTNELEIEKIIDNLS